MSLNYSAVPDETLLQSIRENDDSSDAFAELITRYFWLIRRKAYAVHFVGCDREDLYQEGLIGLYEAARTYDAARLTKFSTYAGVCISNRIAYAVREQSSLGNRMLKEYVSLSDDRFSDLADDFDSRIVNREKLDTVFAQITGKLSQLERTIFMMYLCGYSRVQIAKRAGIPLRAYDNALQRVRQKLKQD